MSSFVPPNYNELVARLVDRTELNDLGPGIRDRSRHDELAALTVEQLVAPRPVRDPQMAEACLAGLWLLHDFLDESHEISQSLATIEGSYWHGIMHRREPDYENAKYWFRRVPAHPIHDELTIAARDVAAAADGDDQAQFLRTQKQWDVFKFIDLCRAAAGGRSTSKEICQRVQSLEWQMLFAYCWRGAGGERP
ncbi:MAG TPA: hypothetical protein VGN12_25080 [Pirellulales bacterium]